MYLTKNYLNNVIFDDTRFNREKIQSIKIKKIKYINFNFVIIYLR